jgi:hypothetical protein
MITPYPVVRKYKYPKFSAETLPTGRTYLTPNGDRVPSVTTILNILPKPNLVAWRARVGAEEANRVTNQACDIGTTMHECLEGYISNFIQCRPDEPPVTENEKVGYVLADNIKRYALIDLDQVYGIEEALYCNNVYAGRTDLIGVYNGKTAVIDYKSSARWKKPEYLEGYKMQIAAYNLCHKTMFGEGLETGVILIAIRDSNMVQKVVLNKFELDRYQDKWYEVLDLYFAQKEEVEAAAAEKVVALAA